MFEIAIDYYDNFYDVMFQYFGITEDEVSAEEYIYEGRLGSSLTKCDQLMCSLVFLNFPPKTLT